MPPTTKIMVFGTFDILHKGHLNFFKQARQLAKKPFLIVSVARDSNVKKIKGKKPTHNQNSRLQKLKKCPLVNRVVVGAKADYIGHILRERPSIIGLGYDQKAYTANLRQLLNKRGLKVKIRRLKPFKPAVYKSSLFKRKMV
jgi:FAD synthetase